MRMTSEALVGTIAIAVTTIGSWTVTAIHWGSANTQISNIQQVQVDQGKKLDQHQQELSDQKVHEATIDQKLDDMISRLDRIERKLP
jgi:hypothetical protein